MRLAGREGAGRAAVPSAARHAPRPSPQPAAYHTAPRAPSPPAPQLLNATRDDEITPRRALTEAPFWVPSASLQLRMLTRAHALLEVLNQVGGGSGARPCAPFVLQTRTAGRPAWEKPPRPARPQRARRGRRVRRPASRTVPRQPLLPLPRPSPPPWPPQGEQALDRLDGLATSGVELVDGSDVWGPPVASGLEGLKLWLARWLGGYASVNAAVTGSAVTATSNKARQQRAVRGGGPRFVEGRATCRPELSLVRLYNAPAPRRPHPPPGLPVLQNPAGTPHRRWASRPCLRPLLCRRLSPWRAL